MFKFQNIFKYINGLKQILKYKQKPIVFHCHNNLTMVFHCPNQWYFIVTTNGISLFLPFSLSLHLVEVE